MSEYRDGAMACSAALKSLAETHWGPCDQSLDEYFKKQFAAMAAILSSAGPLSERASGAMAVLAEYMISSEQDGMYLDLGGSWKPWAAMTADEQHERRDELMAGMEAG